VDLIVTPIVIIFIAGAYLAIGIWGLFWVKEDNELRLADFGDIFAYLSVVLWPIVLPIWLLVRPGQQVEDLAAKKNYKDFKRFMRERSKFDMDLRSKLDKATTPEKPMEISDAREDFRDYHLEELIRGGEWQEALRTANDMLRFAKEQQENARVAVYDRYIKEIKELRNKEMMQS
jgi:hypothetical protein